MKLKNIILGMLLSFVAINSIAATNTSMVKITSIESRSVGYHALFASGSIPADQNCSLTDRAIIIESDSSSKTMLSISLTALVSDKDVIIQVSGCSKIHPDYADTAPVVTKVQIFN